MKTYPSAFLLALICALIATPLVGWLAQRVGALDKPGDRRIHTNPIPRLGGLAVAFAFSVPLASLYLYENLISELFFQNRNHVLGLIVGSIMVLALGIYDDIRGARPLLKLTVQCLTAVACFYLGYQIKVLANPFTGGAIELGILSLPLTVIWIVGVINAVNLIDGLDGLASGVAFFACVTLFILSLNSGDIVSALVTSALGGAILGFLFFNFNPATIFLGDTGSLFLGFVLAVTSLAGQQKGSAAFSLLVPALALGVPILDTSLAVVRRMLTGKPLMGADRHHIHHQLLGRGLSQRQVVGWLYFLCALLAGSSLATAYLRNRLLLAGVLVALGGFLLFCMRYLGYMEHIRAGRRQMFLTDLFTHITERTERLVLFRQALSTISDVDGLWNVLTELVEPFKLRSIRLELHGGPLLGAHGPVERVLHAREEQDKQDQASIGKLELPLGPVEAPLGRLVVVWWQDGGEAHPSLYRLFFELVKAEIDRVIDVPLVASAPLTPLLSERKLG